MASPSSDRPFLLTNQWEVKRSIIEVYQTIMKGNQLNSTQLDEMWNKIKILEQAHEPINSLRSDFQTLLLSIIENLRNQSLLSVTRTPPSNEVESLEHQMLTLKASSDEQVEVVDVWCRIQRFAEESCLCPEKFEDIISKFMSSLSFYTRNGTHPITDADHTLRVHCLSLLTQLNACTNPVDGASSKVFDVENPPFSNTVKKGSPPPDLELLVERMTYFAIFLSALGYGILYLLAKIGRKGDDPTLVTTLHGWTALMMLLVFIRSFIPRPAREELRAMRAIISGVIIGLGLVIFMFAPSMLS